MKTLHALAWETLWQFQTQLCLLLKNIATNIITNIPTPLCFQNRGGHCNTMLRQTSPIVLKMQWLKVQPLSHKAQHTTKTTNSPFKNATRSKITGFSMRPNFSLAMFHFFAKLWRGVGSIESVERCTLRLGRRPGAGPWLVLSSPCRSRRNHSSRRALSTAPAWSRRCSPGGKQTTHVTLER